MTEPPAPNATGLDRAGGGVGFGVPVPWKEKPYAAYAAADAAAAAADAAAEAARAPPVPRPRPLIRAPRLLAAPRPLLEGSTRPRPPLPRPLPLPLLPEESDRAGLAFSLRGSSKSSISGFKLRGVSVLLGGMSTDKSPEASETVNRNHVNT